MVTIDDSLFCILFSSLDGLRCNRLVYYIYLFQLAGLDFEFRYKISPSGLNCVSLDKYLSNLVSDGKLIINDDGYQRLTKSGYFYVCDTLLRYNEYEFFTKSKLMLDKLSDDELFFVCISDIIISDVLKRYGYDGLVKQRDKIMVTLSNLSCEFSDDNLDSAMKICKHFKEGLK